ncbi:MAG: DciA family protein [Caulobacterales bacterium]
MRRSQLLMREPSGPAVPESRQEDIHAPLQRLAKLYLEQVKTLPQRRPARRAGDAALKIVKSLGRDPEPQMSALKENWGEIVGTSFSSRSAPEKLTKSKQGLTLTLKVEGAAAPMIQHQATQILARVNLFAGSPGVKALNIVQGPVTKSAARKAAPPPRLAVLDSGQEAEIEDLLAGITDEKLKASLRRLGRGIYARAASKRF